MPSTSQKQHNLMALVANDPAAAKRLGIPQKVGKEFVRADKGRKFAEGGEMAESKKMAKKEVSFMKKKGAPASMIKHEKAEAGMKKGGKAKGYASGGESFPGKEGYNPYAKGGMTKKFASGGESFPGKEGYNPYAKGGVTKKFAAGGESFPGKEGYNPYAKGGGVEVRGKTKGKMVKMMGGGKC